MASVLLPIHASVPLCSINLFRNNRLSATDASYYGLINHASSHRQFDAYMIDKQIRMSLSQLAAAIKLA